jgi:AraC-like DNA-binding protein
MQPSESSLFISERNGVKKNNPSKNRCSVGMESIQNYYWIHDVLQIYVGLSTWVIQWDEKGGLDWMELTPQSPMNLRPTHFEISYGKESDRDGYYQRCLRRVLKEKRFLVDQHNGFYDIFLPLPMSGKRPVVLYAGFFLKQAADWDSLATQWRKLTGKEPVGADRDFLRYVKMALQLPVLDEPLLKGVLEFLECYADFLMGRQSDVPIHVRVDRLRQRIFATSLPNSAWVEEALGFEKLVPPPWIWYPDKQLAPWMKEELGISRIPTTVFTVMPLQPKGDEVDPVKKLVGNYQIQRECVRFARSVPQTVAENLQDYGVLFLTSADPNKGEAQARIQIREKAESVQAFIKERFGLKSVVGIGRPVSSGEALSESYREAVLALHLCVQAEKTLLFYGVQSRGGSKSIYARLRGTAVELLDTYLQASTDGLKVAADRYVREVLEFAAGNAAIVRSQFMSLLFEFLDRIRKKNVMNFEEEENYATGFSRKLEEADSIYGLIEVFKQTLQGLSLLATRPLEGAKNFRMETTLKYLGEHYSQSLRLPQVARQTGFSVPVFCRVFKQTTGMNFVSYLNKIRVEKAKALLKTSGLNILQVGHACGFQTPHHFIRNFKQWTGLTPGDYRKKSL